MPLPLRRGCPAAASPLVWALVGVGCATADPEQPLAARPGENAATSHATPPTREPPPLPKPPSTPTLAPAPDAAVPADAPPRAAAGGADAAAPDRSVDRPSDATATGLADAGTGGDGGAIGAALNCGFRRAFKECGGDLVGKWRIAGFCSDNGDRLNAGSLSFAAEMTYTFALEPGPGLTIKPGMPELGTWSLNGTRVKLKSTQTNGAVFDNRGSLAYRTDIGHESMYCVEGPRLYIDSGRLRRTAMWVFERM